ncbi:MAG TPA: UDP-N-acetylmuramate dehydrogenase [Ktedonobacteraceae bacterium]|nr:UDP-N-acetylmuramate dehydrogenase [Ktedonobacteraceae bacterium]
MAFESSVAYSALQPHFQERLHLHEPLAKHSSFGVGGPADLWLTIEQQQELHDLVSTCAHQRWPLLVVGAGSNILYADAGVRGIVASMQTQHYHLEEQSEQSALVVAEAGVRWESLLKDLLPLGWAGLEFALTIPGTLGAGIISNVGTRNQHLGQALEWIEVLDARNCNNDTSESMTFPVLAFVRYQRDELDLGYRHSRFRNQRLTYIDTQGQLVLPKRHLIDPAELVVTVALRVQRQDPASLLALAQQPRQERNEDDPAQRHAGSIFKDPMGTTAHTLIEQTGLAGKTRGGAQISARNANYIVNLGGATAADIAALIIEAHQHVLAQMGIQLEPNVELLGEWQQYTS